MPTELKITIMYTNNDFIRLDWAAKYILRDKADFEIFEGLMTVLLGENVKIVQLLESEKMRAEGWDEATIQRLTRYHPN